MRRVVRALLEVASLVVAALGILLSSSASAFVPPPPCDIRLYTVGYCITAQCGNESGSFQRRRQFWCGNGKQIEPDVPDACAGDLCWPGAIFDTSGTDCGTVGSSEICGNGMDDDANGCIDDNCKKGEDECSCTAQCSASSCSNPQTASCNPHKEGVAETCGNGKDDNCNGAIDEFCFAGGGGGGGPGGGSGGGGGGGGGGPPGPQPPCKDQSRTAGSDPIILGNRSAVTEPFTDFSVEAGSLLAVSRTYSSAHHSLQGGSPGEFGRGWTHNWESWLECSGTSCVVAGGPDAALRFGLWKQVTSLDGTETWDLYRPWEGEVSKAGHRALLARRPNGVWIVFTPDGVERHYATVCDSCSGADPVCVDPRAGGRARLVRWVASGGRSLSVNYSRPSGVLLAISDDLGHTLELRGEAACVDGLATSLRYDGVSVASYSYDGLELLRSTDADGRVLRSYSYDVAGSGLLQAVRNESGDAIAEFSYDALGQAIGVVDSGSSVSVSYAGGQATVTEYFGNSQATGARSWDPDGNIMTISDRNSCGPPRSMKYADRQLQCRTDSLGHAAYYQRDALGRATYYAEYAGAPCPLAANSAPPAPSRETWYAYGLSRAIAQGVTLDVDAVTSVSRRSTFNGTARVGTRFDYSQGSDPIDPTGYTCVTEGALPAGSVVCRQFETGYVDVGAGAVFERHATFYSYDSHGRLVRAIGPVNLDRPATNEVTPLEERRYWADTETPARRGRLHQIWRYPGNGAAPLITWHDYDAFGLYRVTAPDGRMTTYLRDGRGRVAFVIAPDGATTETRFYDGADPRLRIGPTGAAVRYGYDAKGRLASTEYLSADPDAVGATPLLAWSEHHIYDPAGNRIHTERRDAAGIVRWRQDREFDVQHRLVRETNPEYPAQARTWSFDPAGYLTTIADEIGRKTGVALDAVGRVKKVRRSGVDPQGVPVGLDVASYTYVNYRDDLQSVTAGNASQTQYKYDDFGRAYSVFSYDRSGAFTYTFDARGNPLRRKDGQVTITWTYDGVDRVLARTATSTVDPTAPAYTHRYDETGEYGRLTSVVSSDRVVRYGYDLAGRLASERVEKPGLPALVTEYRYDADGALSELWYPSGLKVKYERDAASRAVARVLNLNDGSALADGVAYWPGGPVAALRFRNNETLARSYDLRYAPRSIQSGPLALSYTVDASGDITGITEGALARTLVYDFLDRLVSSPGWFTYGYDGGGNRTSDTVDGVSGTYNLSMDVVRRRDVQSGGRTVSELVFNPNYAGATSHIGKYDAAGVWVVAGVCLKHDPLGRLDVVGPPRMQYGVGSIACTRESDLLSVSSRFAYDGSDRRVARWDAGGGWTEYVHGPGTDLLGELAQGTASWTRKRDYVWLDGMPLAQIEYPGATPGGEGFAYAIHVDHIGLPRAMTNAAAHTVWSASTRPYGDLVEATSVDTISGRTVVTNLRLPGQYDERLFAQAGISGMQGPYYNWNRWYLPSVGRYTELDPIALSGGFNTAVGVDWYNYAGGNPLTNVDPNGEQVPCSPGESTISCKCKQPGGSWACQLQPPDPCGGPKPKPPTPRPPPKPIPTPVPDPTKRDPKDKCWDDYVWCVNSPIGSMPSNQYGYSQCQVCQEQCIQDGGIWPVLARNNKPCR